MRRWILSLPLEFRGHQWSLHPGRGGAAGDPPLASAKPLLCHLGWSDTPSAKRRPFQGTNDVFDSHQQQLDDRLADAQGHQHEPRLGPVRDLDRQESCRCKGQCRGLGDLESDGKRCRGFPGHLRFAFARNVHHRRGEQGVADGHGPSDPDQGKGRGQSGAERGPRQDPDRHLGVARSDRLGHGCGAVQRAQPREGHRFDQRAVVSRPLPERQRQRVSDRGGPAGPDDLRRQGRNRGGRLRDFLWWRDSPRRGPSPHRAPPHRPPARRRTSLSAPPATPTGIPFRST